ncbi:hypothetical protein Rhal01_02999 [Rubritalea halochordaticola]|uniref:Knr4/Smi1-like domain-containing protein n=1 Tax=Rubritalea halochordaticola TaxID=714537 RepID=A0ABP9V2B2_9BACT
MIKDLIDKALAHWVGLKLNCHPGHIPSNMLTGEAQDDWAFWVAVPSTVTDGDIAELEGEWAIRLSPQYREVLQHRHFIELQIGEVSLFPHPSDGWKEAIRKRVFGCYPRELLYGRGFLPFADFSDWGLWCFGINDQNVDGEYPIYLWDHDKPDEFQRIADDLTSGLTEQAKPQNA